MKRSPFIILFWILTGIIPLIAQQPATKSKKAIDAYNAALRSFSLYKYDEAEQLLIEAINADQKFIDAYLVLAEVFEDAGNPVNAIEAYKRGLPLNEKYYPYGFIRLGNLEYKEGKYEDAMVSYNRFLSLNSETEAHIAKAKDGIERCEFAIRAIKNPVDFRPVNLGPQINSSNEDYWPSLSADEQTLVITRLIPSDDIGKKIQEDFYISHWKDTAWQMMENAGKPLNTSDNEGAQTLSADGRYMVFTACNRQDGLGRCDLYYSVKEGEIWSKPKNIGSPVNSTYRETQPSISPDGRFLYFSSDRPGGKGQHDLWMAEKDLKGHWKTPVNLGDTINTQGEEMSPFIHPDNQSLYFSSNWLKGLGGYDLFISRRDSSGHWQIPVNLGYPINTNRDETGMIVNAKGDKAYYSSDIIKKNGKDIYSFNLPVADRPLPVTYMKGIVFDIRDKSYLKARFELIDLESGKTIFNAYSDSITGEFLVSIPLNRNYMLNVSHPSYLFFSENFSLQNIFQAQKPYVKDVPLQPIMAGNSVILKNVFFETNSYALRKESFAELNRIVDFLNANKNIIIEIGGHTDNTGSAEYNQTLSESRARAVADYLLSQSILPQRIVSKGYGFTKPIANNETEEGKAQNRRTELKVIQ